MFAWWGRTVSRFRWLVLAATVAAAVFAAIWGTGVFGHLADGGFEHPDSEAQRALERIEDEVGRQGADLIAIYSSDELTVTDPEFRDAVTEVTDRVRRHAEVVEVQSWYQTQAPMMVSEDQHSTYVTVRLTKDPDTDTIAEVRDELAADGLTTEVGGPMGIFLDVNSQISQDLTRAELISFPILLVLLLFVFGSVVAASTPLLVGGIAIVGGLAVIRLLTLVTDVSVFSINVITLLGLGLAIDYALFVVSRFREELDQGRSVPDAVARTMATAGRTITVSGITLGLALAGLLIFPQMFLRSVGFGGVAAVAVALLASLTFLPALLAIVGPRIDALRLPGYRRASSTAGHRFWAQMASAVMRRPALFAIGSAVILLVLAAPFARVEFGGPDERVLPEGTESRVVSERLDEEFPGTTQSPILVLVSGAPAQEAARFAERIADIDGVESAAPTANQGESTVITVSYDGEHTSQQARDIVTEIRDLSPPGDAEVLVGGATADLVDLLDGLAERLPLMVALVAGITFVLLFLAFGSVVLPLKAIVMNVLSIGASFGAVVWIFQDGHFADVLHFTPTGFLEATQPVLMLAVLFGLSMDYEVFLLSRVREQWDIVGDNTTAVATGVQRTGRIITAAAILLAVVVGAFTTSGITLMKMIGLGMLVAIILDATLVRLVLVPATMRLLGRYNWWAPRFLRPLYAKYGISESEAEPERELAGVR